MKTLSDRLRVHYNLTADDIAEEAADRIDALEECLRDVDNLIEHQYSGTREAMTALQLVADKARALLEAHD